MDEKGRLDLRDIVGRWSRSIERCAGAEVGQAHRQLIDHATAIAESDGSHTAGRGGVRAQELERGHPVLHHHVPVHLALHRATVVIVSGIPAERGQRVRTQRDEVGRREASYDVLDVRIQATVFVDDQHRRLGPRGPFRHGHVTAHGSGTVGGVVFDVLGLNALVRLRDLSGPRVLRLQRIEHRHRCGTAPDHLRGAFQEAASIDEPVYVPIEQRQHLFWEITRLLSFSHFLPPRGLGVPTALLSPAGVIIRCVDSAAQAVSVTAVTAHGRASIRLRCNRPARGGPKAFCSLSDRPRRLPPCQGKSA